MGEVKKGFWIRRDGCIWNGEVKEMSFRDFAGKVSAFADEEHGYASPYIVTRRIAGIEVDIWYDENFLSYQPVPSGIVNKGTDELLMGMLFVCGADEENGDSRSLTDEELLKIQEAYRVPTFDEAKVWESVAPGLGMYMLGFKLLHYDF